MTQDISFDLFRSIVLTIRDGPNISPESFGDVSRDVFEFHLQTLMDEGFAAPLAGGSGADGSGKYRLTSKGVSFAAVLEAPKRWERALKHVARSKGAATLSDAYAYARAGMLTKPMGQAAGLRKAGGSVVAYVLLAVLIVIIVVQVVSALGTNTDATFGQVADEMAESDPVMSFGSVSETITEPDEAPISFAMVPAELDRSGNFEALSPEPLTVKTGPLPQEIKTRLEKDGQALCANSGADEATVRLCATFERATLGDAEAIYTLDSAYYAGELITADATFARRLTHESADRGYPPAKYDTCVYFSQGEVGEQSFEKAIPYCASAAADGVTDAMYNMGGFHMEGLGTPRNKTRAVGYFLAAASAGDEEAEELVQPLLYELSKESRAAANAFADNLIGRDGSVSTP